MISILRYIKSFKLTNRLHSLTKKQLPKSIDSPYLLKKVSRITERDSEKIRINPNRLNHH